MKEVQSKEEFEGIINLNENKLIVVDFFTSWCRPCTALAPFLEQLSKDFKNVIFIKVNAENVEEVSAKYQIDCFPTIKYIINGKEVHTVKGANRDAILNAVQKIDPKDPNLEKTLKKLQPSDAEVPYSRYLLVLFVLFLLFGSSLLSRV